MSESPDRGAVVDQSDSEIPSRWRRFIGGWGAWRWRSLLLLAPGIILFVFFVQQDEPALSTGPALLIDNLLRVVSLLALASVAVLLVAREGIAQRAAAIASITVLALGGAVVTSGLWSPWRDLPMVALAVVATVLAACNLWLQRGTASNIKVSATSGVAGLLAVASVPAFNFWAETSYLPSRNIVTLLGAVEVEPQLAPDMSLHLVVSSTMENPSDVQARVLMSELTVCSFVDENDLYAPSDADSANPDNCIWPPAPFSLASWVDPEAKSTASRSVAMDPERPLVQVRMRWWYARADRLVLGSAEEVTGPALGDCAWAERRHIKAQSRLSSLALMDLSLVHADVKGDEVINYFIYPADDINCNQPDLSGPLEQYLALAYDTSIWVGWPTKPAAVN